MYCIPPIVICHDACSCSLQLTILILPLALAILDTSIPLDIMLMQLSRLVTKLEILLEEIPAQQGLKQLIYMSVLLIQR